MKTPSPARIQSHATPKHRHLKQHVAEVTAAAEAILAEHRSAPWATPGERLIAALAWLHDLGKATAAFQAYIADPDRWQGRPETKGHTLPSLVLAALWCAAEGHDDVTTLALALAVRGHHGAQPHDDDSLWRASLLDDAKAAVLREQLASLDRVALAHEGVTDVPATPDPKRAVWDAADVLEDALAVWRRRPLDALTAARSLARAAYSVLLEADKVFLAVETSAVKDYLHRAHSALSAGLVDRALTALASTPMDALRARARDATAAGLAATEGAAVRTLTLPTGAGKTLLAARWALAEREAAVARGEPPPVIVVALPMLSIVEQTERVWRGLLGAAPDDGDTLMPFHSLSERTYDPELDRATEDFFLDTWRSEVVVTTFDQLLLALYSDNGRHALRYHRLLHARVVLDEAQYVPPVLWSAASAGLRALTAQGDTRVLAMSATPAPLLEGAVETVADPDALYRGLRRYELRLRLTAPVDFDAFVAEFVPLCRARLAAGEGTLVTLNVRATAREVWERFHTAGLDPVLLSGDMTPAHRLAVIAAVRTSPVRVVVSTQCVEAGVDLDLHHVLRDLAPLDALVQIAGRCNRHALREAPGTVTVVRLKGPDGKEDAGKIYDPVALQTTQEVLAGRDEVPEAEVLGLCRAWYALLRDRKNLGGDHLWKWARLEGAIDVRKLLRDEDTRETLVVLERDPGLAGALKAALAVADRWDRRAALRALAPRVARESVSVSRKVWERVKRAPIDKAGAWVALAPGEYHAVCGVDSRG